jgi:hypothetical protein
VSSCSPICSPAPPTDYPAALSDSIPSRMAAKRRQPQPPEHCQITSIDPGGNGTEVVPTSMQTSMKVPLNTAAFGLYVRMWKQAGFPPIEDMTDKDVQSQHCPRRP